MDDYKELIERLRYEGYDVSRNEAANAIESLLAENERLKDELAKYRDAPVVAWVEVVDSYEGPYHFNGEKLLNVGKHKLIVKPGE